MGGDPFSERPGAARSGARERDTPASLFPSQFQKQKSQKFREKYGHQIDPEGPIGKWDLLENWGPIEKIVEFLESLSEMQPPHTGNFVRDCAHHV
jgi:hypothetical protein